MNKFVNFKEIQEKKQNGEEVNASLLSRAIIEEAKYQKNYANAESLFQDLDKKRASFRENTPFYYSDINSYQRAIATMVRYASNSEKAQSYATHFFDQIEKPLRTPAQEIIILTNLLFVYWMEGEMDKGLTIIQLAIDIGTFEINPQHFVEDKYNNTHSDNLEVFENVAQKVLVHFNLQFAPDKSKLIPSTKKYKK